MSRPLLHRYRLSAQARALAPLRVSSGDVDRPADIALARDGMGYPFLPGTGVAGALRGWLRGIAASDVLWGGGPDSDGDASRVTVEDALVSLPPGARVLVRDGVRIDRFTGSAAARAKFDAEVLPRGTLLELGLSIDVEDADQDAAARQLLSCLRAGLREGLVRIGGGRTRGYGRVGIATTAERAPTAVTMTDFSSAAAFLDGLVEGGRPLAEDALPPPDLPGSELQFQLDWRPGGPVMVKADVEGLAVDMLPLSEVIDSGQLAMVLPWSGLKGVLRGHAERIVATMEPKSSVDLVGTLFGTPSGNVGGAGMGALTGDDCYTTTEISPTAWEAALRHLGVGRIEDLRGDPQTAIAQAGLRVQAHNAIDRWSGAVADGQLFSLAVTADDLGWEAIRLGLDLDRLTRLPDVGLAALALLLIVLQDFRNGDLPVGFGGNRGMGHVVVDSMKLRILGSPRAPLPWTDEWTELAGAASGLDADVARRVGTAWQNWLDGMEPEESDGIPQRELVESATER